VTESPKSTSKVASSFRDPAGFLYWENDKLFRQVNVSYQDDYDLLLQSGLYNLLVQKKLLIPHQEIPSETSSDQKSQSLKDDVEVYKVLQPELIEFISYPYEWSFAQLKEAALLTLQLQAYAIQHGMSLKDASAYNVQFNNGSAIFIDTLSFEKYENGPWVAYKQFCQHFLAPLLLMVKVDYRLVELLMTNIDGIPLDLASKLLPKSSYLNLASLMHIHLHAKQQKANGGGIGLEVKNSGNKFNKRSMLVLIDSLKSTIIKLEWKAIDTEWNDYYTQNNNYQSDSLLSKEALVYDLAEQIQPNIIWDLGANDGRFSRVLSPLAKQVISWDIDISCVQRSYQQIQSELKNHSEKQQNILPLKLDLTNPSASIGWANTERYGLMERGGCDLILSLGLVHHLAISNNLPLEDIAKTFSLLANNVIIEWVPKEDSQVIKLLSTREDIFPGYTSEGFEKAFGSYFVVSKKLKIENSHRTLYLLKLK